MPLTTIPTITAFARSPDGGKGLARDMRVRWALEEVGQPYAVRLVSFADMKAPAHLALHPFGQIPTYEEGDLVLFESGAIVFHLAEAHAGLLPAGAHARARAITWMFAALNTVEPPILDLQTARLLEGDQPWYEQRLPAIKDRIRDRLGALSARLGDADWLDGAFNAGDLMMVAVLLRLKPPGCWTIIRTSPPISRAVRRAPPTSAPSPRNWRYSGARPVDNSSILDNTSSMTEPASTQPDINQRIAERISALRAQRGLSLDALAKKSDVSRSTISLIERVETSPTAVVLDKLAFGLGVTLASLFEAPQPDASPLVRRADQLQWTDPQSGYMRRNLSPPHFRSPLQMVEIDFPAGATVTYEAGPREAGIHQQVWMLAGAMEIILEDTHHRLQAGDCLAMQENPRIVFQNTSQLPARYIVVVNTGFLT